MPKKYTVLAVDTRELNSLMSNPRKQPREIWDEATGWCLVEADDPEQAILRARLQMIGEEETLLSDHFVAQLEKDRLATIVVLSVVMGWHEDLNPL